MSPHSASMAAYPEDRRNENSMKHQRFAFTITTSNVLFILLALAGGTSFVSARSTTILAPTPGTWKLTGGMNCSRAYHSATLLKNGNVLVAGGTNGSQSYTQAEVYHPTTDTWTVTGSMHDSRAWYTATLLANGKVLVAGGWNNGDSSSASAELYTPGS